MSVIREAALARLRRELFGPAHGEEERVSGRPYWRYLCGMLFPVGVDSSASDEDDEKDGAEALRGEEQSNPALAQAYDSLPSSMAVSFFVERGDAVSVQVEGARYEVSEEKKDVWHRRPLGTPSRPTVAEIALPDASRLDTAKSAIWGGLAEVNVLSRPRGGGRLVTVSLVNRQPAAGGGAGEQIGAMLFQCRFTVRVVNGVIGEYPRAHRSNLHAEDDELALSYSQRRTFAVGHGCAAQWAAGSAQIGEIVAEPMPVQEVHGLTTEIELPDAARPALDIGWLASPSTTPGELRASLAALVTAYEEWCDGQASTASALPLQQAPVARRMVERQRLAIARMRRGIDALLGTDPDVLTAFRIAQEAMRQQFELVRRRRGPQDLGQGDVSPIPPIRPLGQGPSWRPFQLAYQLLVMESLVNPDSEDREQIDLLWFPTGGGKTEAYLLLSALEIALRRLKHGPAGGGTAVLMRYTLRLLTSQQFERASTLVSVLELLRLGRFAEELGGEPIRLGLWVGGGTTPNSLDHDSEQSPGARQLLEQILDSLTPDNPFQLRTCPLCETRIIPERQSPRRDDYGVRVSAVEFLMFCPDERCPLHACIPVSVVDDDLFSRPPALLLGTIDKFARMVWDARSRVFFGSESTLPPTLVVQDELHLISGPLGTISGLYEAGLETVMRESGRPPKYIAATATIQRAQEQCRALYARDVTVFPPPGLDASSSYFSREDTASPGRVFVGVMGHGLYSSLTSLIQVSAAAACLPSAMPDGDARARDIYWTQVLYHNSRQELGKTTTMLRDDVQARLAVLEPDASRRREFDSIEELSANLKGSEVSEAIERLKVEAPNPAVIDAVACTNMISVGVDISRLGLMVVKGQPKSTSEYIQASSRVGRDTKRPPGIVVALYAAMRPRDRSHYESFQSYHAALYRAVEPATVTPFSPQAKERALHATLVLAMRHALGWVEPRDAREFDPDKPKQKSLIDRLRLRLLAACRDDERQELSDSLNAIIEKWQRMTREEGAPLSFSDARQFRPLLAQFPADGASPGDAWPTLNSMRHVDGEVAFRIRGGE